MSAYPDGLDVRPAEPEVPVEVLITDPDARRLAWRTAARRHHPDFELAYLAPHWHATVADIRAQRARRGRAAGRHLDGQLHDGYPAMAFW